MITGLLILIPLAGSAIVMFSLKEKVIRRNALVIALIELATALVALLRFSNTGFPEQLLSWQWIRELNIKFQFGIDGISLLLVLLTTFLIPVIIISSYNCQSRRANIFYGLILITEASLIGVFTALNGIVFYIFWELALIPVYFIIAIWGGQDRIRITFKFLIYTLTGSLLMLAALIYLYFHTPAPHSFEFSALYKAIITKQSQIWIFAAFFLAFAIKIPVVPFHTWQPDAYAEAPPAGSMILAGIMLKMGIYGIIRLLIPVCPLAFPVLGYPVVILIVAGIVYSSIIAIRQNDLKRLIAYMSLAHVGLITAGAISVNSIALQGAVIQMISHGINVVGLFIIIDIIEVRYNSRNIRDLGGLVNTMPLVAILFMIIILASIALPLTNGFVGEFLLLLGLFGFSPWISAVAGTTIIFSAVYMLWMYQRVMLGNLPVHLKAVPADPGRNGILALIPLIILIFLVGCYPKPFLELAQPAIAKILSVITITPQ